MTDVTVTYQAAASAGYNFTLFYSDLAAIGTASYSGQSTTEYTLTNSAGRGIVGQTTTVKYHFIGTGLTFSGGEPTGGTINTIEILDGSNTVLVTMSGFSFNAGTFETALDTYRSAPTNPAPLHTFFRDNVAYSYTGNTGNDSFIAGQNPDSFSGGGGANTVSYQNAPAGVTASLANPVSSNTGDAAGDSYTNILNLRGSNLNDVLIGDNNVNFLRGLAGADVLNGGGGFDTADYLGASAGVTVDLSSGSAALLVGTGEAQGDSFISIENLRGTGFNDVLRGNSGANQLTGMTGADTFFTTDGQDTIADFNRSSGTYNQAEHDKIQFLSTHAIYDWTQLQSRLSESNGNTVIDLGNGNTLTLTGVSNSQLHDSDLAGDIYYSATPEIVVTLRGTGRTVTDSQDGSTTFTSFWGFGDSNSDSGYFWNHPFTNPINQSRNDLYLAAKDAGGGKSTTVGGWVNVEYLSEMYGLTATPNGVPGGTNYAASGATISGRTQNAAAWSLEEQIDDYLAHHTVDPNGIYYFSGGPNSNRTAATLGNTPAGNAYMESEADKLAAKIVALHNAGAQYFVLDANAGSGTFAGVYLNRLVTDLTAADVPFLVAGSTDFVNDIIANPSAYGITNAIRANAGPYTPSNLNNGGGSVVNPGGTQSQLWAYVGSQNQANSEHWLFADTGHLATAGHELQANFYRALIENAVPIVGQTLTADVVQYSTVTQPISYQWQRLVGNTWTDIAGATGVSYTIQNDDLNFQLRAEVSRTYDNGNRTITEHSAPTYAVEAADLLAVDDRWYVSRDTTTHIDWSAVLGNDVAAGLPNLDSAFNPIHGAVAINGESIEFTTPSGPIELTNPNTAQDLLYNPLTAQFDYKISYNGETDTGNVLVALIDTTENADVLTINTLAHEFSYIEGKGGNDNITGGAGTDFLVGGLDNDILNGAGGNDTAVYSGNRTDYSVTDNDNGTWTITDNRVGTHDGVDTLSFIEFARFADQTISLVDYDKTAQDFDGNGTSDILWRNTFTGDVGAWQMHDGVATWTGISSTGTSWNVLGKADVNGDHNTDILVGTTSNGVTSFGYWEMHNSAATAYHDIGAAGAGWSIVGTGDFNGDGTDDILWRNSSTGDVGASEMHNGVASWVGIGSTGTSWNVLGTADVNGDHNTDILVGTTNNGVTYFGYWEMQNSAVTGYHGIGAAGAGWGIVGTGDFNNDGTDDILWRNGSTGDVGASEMHNGVASWVGIGSTGTSWDVLGTADVNGDHNTDILVGTTDNGVTALGYWEMHNTANTGYHGIGQADASWLIT